MILLETMVLSELRKGRHSAGVIAYLEAQLPDTVFVSAMTIGGIKAGIEKQRKASPKASDFAEELSQWLMLTLMLMLMEMQFAEFILPATPAIAKLWGRLCVQSGNMGIDNLIAATALVHNLLAVTRNVKDFEAAGAGVFDPFNRQEINLLARVR